jgi:hypothetical protein
VTTDIDQALAGQPVEPPTLAGAAGRRATCRRHDWVREADGSVRCARCPTIRDESRFRRGRSSRRLGSDQERRIERVYGPRKVGEYGDAIDHLGALWKWQSKATRAAPPLWLAAIDLPTFRVTVPAAIVAALRAMDPLSPDHVPVLIRSYVRQGLPTRDWLFVRAEDYPGNGAGKPYHAGGFGYVILPGSTWLDLYGRDEPKV